MIMFCLVFTNVCLFQDDAVSNAKCRDGTVVKAKVNTKNISFRKHDFLGKFHFIILQDCTEIGNFCVNVWTKNKNTRFQGCACGLFFRDQKKAFDFILIVNIVVNSAAKVAS